ncbi:MAG TPA: cbb3-type cytochrome c oxidase subunit I [Candidatus Paceibacterota bacterium]|jgi:cytochrome o ubiquinol oxidase subunit 1|nr:cbb3-type cytochrome c oxidase subunit I [Candidatus Paceibacterota bacterium]
MFGRLTLDALPHEWFTIGGTASIIGGAIVIAALLTYYKRWKWLWREWLTSTDPKKIGIMYIVVAMVMLFRGALDAGMIWLQQSLSSGMSHGYLDPYHFQQIFTAHGVIMVFFVTTGFLFGMMNFILPLQIGARDVAYPLLNTLSFWLYVAGAILANMFFMFGGEFAAAGWLSVPPLSELAYSPGVGVDYWIWTLQVSGLGSLLSGINLLVTTLKMRAPGMTLRKMPMFAWASVWSNLLVITVFPVLTMTLFLLTLDRTLGMHFFTSDMGGNPMMYINLIWSWGHPEVYILMIPQFGMFSEIVSVLSGKKLFGRTSLMAAAAAITILSGFVWLHHFFTMGAGADVNAFFGIMTGIIAIPTAVQIFNWIGTMWRGRIRLATPMYWFLGFVLTFTIGGIAGVLLGIPGADFELHNSLFLVAHFHTMLIGGALFGIFAGIAYWFPKAAGWKLNERVGRYAFWCWLVGLITSFTPLYILGFMGATRRLDHYDASLGWQGLFIVAACGFVILGLGALLQLVQVGVSFRQRRKNRDTTGDPWGGRTLEWAVSSPPPFYNFAVIPRVRSAEPLLDMHDDAASAGTAAVKYEDIEMPKNTPMGIYLSGLAFLIGFSMVWHIWWLAILSVAGVIVCIVRRTLDEETEYVIPAAEVERMEREGLTMYDPNPYA